MGSRMTDLELDTRGYFWWADESVPEGHFAPDSAVTGQIQVSRNGTVRLVLDNFLPAAPGRPTLDPAAPLIREPQLAVVGLINRGQEHVRLEELSLAGLSFGSAMSASQSLKARMCVRGPRLIATLPPNRFCTALRLSLAGLEDWLKPEQAHVESNDAGLIARIPYFRENTFDVDGTEIRIGAESNYNFQNGVNHITLQQEGYLTYTPRSPMTLDEVREIVRQIEDLLVLVTDCERTLGFPVVRVDQTEHWHRVTYETLHRPQREIVWSDLWTDFPSLLPSFGQLAKNWFSKSPKFGPGFHLYLGNRRGVRLFVEHRFSSLVWGLEAFHRNIGIQTNRPALTEKIARILNAVETRDRRWLTRVLRTAGEPSLAQRLFEVLEPLPIGLNKNELRNFAKRCADERNLISHFGGRGTEHTYETHVRRWATMIYALDVLYHARILQELGFEEAELHRIFWQIPASGRIRHVLALNGLNIS